MNQSNPSIQSNPKKKSKGCCIALAIAGGLMIVMVLCVALLFLARKPILRALGLWNPPATEVYQSAPDLVSSQILSQEMQDLGIPGVRIYVMPIKDSPNQGLFVILDASQGYTGLSPIEGADQAFLDLLKRLSDLNASENMRIAHLTADYRDEQGESYLAFTVDMAVVENYVNGSITKDEFYQAANINLVDTLRNLGLDQLLEEVLP
ncbi:MAG: hypothetical protein MUO40_11175 [Anaerolineaceae bacterium]|nr:hypothetical protein [Anaerolineaceae bacterium]